MDYYQLIATAFIGILIITVLSALVRLNTKKQARKMNQKTIAMYDLPHVYRRVTPDMFPMLDLEFYDECKNYMASKDFEHLTDETDEATNHMVFKVTTFFRVMISSDKSIVAAFYDPKPGFFTNLLFKAMGAPMSPTYDFYTEFENGHFVITSNAYKAGLLKKPPEIHGEFLQVNTPLSYVYGRHLERLQEFREEFPDIPPIICHSMEDVHASQEREEALKRDYRKGLGGITRDELHAIADAGNEESKIAGIGTTVSKKDVDQIYADSQEDATK